jgi:signal transduction histidine kinase
MDNKEGNLNEEQVRYAHSIYAAGNDLLTLINDILDLAKIEAGKVDLSVEPVSVARLIDKLRRRFEPVAAERKLELRFTVDSDCPATIESDPHRLQQVLTNLLSNARWRTRALEFPPNSTTSSSRPSARPTARPCGSMAAPD